jgi:hypothetical protein
VPTPRQSHGPLCRHGGHAPPPGLAATHPPGPPHPQPLLQELLEAELDVKAALNVEPDSADLQALSKRVKCVE